MRVVRKEDDWGMEYGGMEIENAKLLASSKMKFIYKKAKLQN